MVAASEEGVVFCFIPEDSDHFVNIEAVDSEITCLSIVDNGSKIYVGSKEGELYCF